MCDMITVAEISPSDTLRMGARQSSEADGPDGSLRTVLGSAFCPNLCERDQDPHTIKIDRAQQGVNADAHVKTRLAPPASRLARPTLQSCCAWPGVTGRMPKRPCASWRRETQFLETVKRGHGKAAVLSSVT